jgi:hypothetical protein
MKRTVLSARQDIGDAVAATRQPEMALRFTPAANGDPIDIGELPDPEDEALEKEADLLARMQSVKLELAALAAEPLIPDVWHHEGHVMAIRSWASQAIASINAMVEKHNAALRGDSKFRRIR